MCSAFFRCYNSYTLVVSSWDLLVACQPQALWFRKMLHAVNMASGFWPLSPHVSETLSDICWTTNFTVAYVYSTAVAIVFSIWQFSFYSLLSTILYKLDYIFCYCLFENVKTYGWILLVGWGRRAILVHFFIAWYISRIQCSPTSNKRFNHYYWYKGNSYLVNFCWIVLALGVNSTVLAQISLFVTQMVLW